MWFDNVRVCWTVTVSFVAEVGVTACPVSFRTVLQGGAALFSIICRDKHEMHHQPPHMPEATCCYMTSGAPTSLLDQNKEGAV